MNMGCLSIFWLRAILQSNKPQKMKKSFDVEHIIRLQKGVRKIKSKHHCKWSRNEQAVLYELTVFFEQSKTTKTRRRKFSFRLYRGIKFIAKLLVKVITGNLFGL
jgi:hypothetical protein